MSSNLNKLAPICLFTFNRLEETIKTVTALQNNFLSDKSDLYIFSDGFMNETESLKVQEVRNYLKTINGFKSVTIFESESKKGLAKSIIEGVSKMFEKNDSIIVLEDDLISSPNFLNFMNQGLAFYEKNEAIMSISGYTLDLKSLKNINKDYYIGFRASSWGWATWKKEWINIDWEVKKHSVIKYNLSKRYQFMRGGSDLPKMLRNQQSGKINSWAIRWCFHQFLLNKYTVFASSSKIMSIGYGINATHTKKTKRFHTELDSSNKIDFKFDKEIQLNDNLIKEFRQKFSVLNRIIDKFKK